MIEEIKDFTDLPKTGSYFVLVYKDWCWQSFQIMFNILRDTKKYNLFLVCVHNHDNDDNNDNHDNHDKKKNPEDLEDTPILLLFHEGTVLVNISDFSVLKDVCLKDLWRKHIQHKNSSCWPWW